jgi:hypothetical protein
MIPARVALDAPASRAYPFLQPEVDTMRLSSILPPTGRAWLLAGSALAVFALGCSHTPITTEQSLELHSCLGGARSVRFTAAIGPMVTTADAQAGSSNIIGTPDVQFLGFGVQVTAELDNVALGDPVTFLLSATTLGYEVSVEVIDVAFYTVPPDQIPPDPECTPASSPEFTLANETALGLGLVLNVSNPTSQPMMLTMLDLTESPNLLPPSSLDWTNPDFNALPWHTAVGGGTSLDPAAPPLVIDLPDTAPGAEAALLRFSSFSEGGPMRGIVQASLVEVPLATTPTTWGAVKALYRN